MVIEKCTYSIATKVIEAIFHVSISNMFPFLDMNIMQDSGVHVDVQNMNITTDFLLLHLRKGSSLIMIELKVFYVF